MKYSLHYASKMKDEADEIRCPINQLGEIFDYVKEHPEKRYHIEVKTNNLSEKLFKQLDYIKAVTENYVVSCNTWEDFLELKNRKYISFFNYPVTDWELFHTLLNKEVSDIITDSSLNFQMDKLLKIKNEYNIKIRVCPNYSTTPLIGKISYENENSFFIRPEDISLYEDVIDYIYFKTNVTDIETTFFNIYKKENFPFKLRELVPYVANDVENPYISKLFAKKRFDCGQHCLIPGERKCELCKHQFMIANALPGLRKD